MTRIIAFFNRHSEKAFWIVAGYIAMHFITKYW